MQNKIDNTYMHEVIHLVVNYFILYEIFLKVFIEYEKIVNKVKKKMLIYFKSVSSIDIVHCLSTDTKRALVSLHLNRC